MKLLVIKMLCLLSLMAAAQVPVKKGDYNLLIGTYTNTGKSEGIYVYSFNTLTGDFSYKAKATGIVNPSFLTVSSDLKNVYSVSETSTDRKGIIYAYNFNALSGELELLNKVSSGGEAPCHVSLDNSKKFLFAANYASGSVAAIPVNTNGSLSDQIQVIRHTGSSINKTRQTQPHVHSAFVSPDNKFLFTPDLGTDQVSVYRIDPTNGAQPLSEAFPAFETVTPGSGPRHIAFLPGGKMLYLVQEMSGTVSAFDYRDGKLQLKQTITMVREGFTGRTGAADIHVSPDGRFLYASNRGDANDIVVYAVGKSGSLTYAGRQSVLGKGPRNFAIDPTGNYLLVGNQNTDQVMIFKRNQKTGMLAPTGKTIDVGAPVCLKFAPIRSE